jgi:hypothetical protein
MADQRRGAAAAAATAHARDQVAVMQQEVRELRVQLDAVRSEVWACRYPHECPPTLTLMSERVRSATAP